MFCDTCGVDTPARIRALREKRGLTREQLAERLGTTRLEVWRVETGKTPLRTCSADCTHETTKCLPSWATALDAKVKDLVA